MMCVVQKAFVGHGEEFSPNQLIDGGMFPKVQQLISQHYLRPATESEIASAVSEDDMPAPARRAQKAEPTPEPVKKKKKGLRIRRRRH